MSCDTTDLKRISDEDQKPRVIDADDDASGKNIRSYQKKSKDYPICSKLSSIREEMKEFCDNMDRFVDENKIVFKNGEVEGFWGERKTANENPQDKSSSFIDKGEDREIEDKVSASEETKLRWWCSKERKLKVKEILRKRINDARKNKIKPEDTEARKNPDHTLPDDKNQAVDITNNIQGDLKTKILPNACRDSTYSAKNAENDKKSGIDIEVGTLNIPFSGNAINDLLDERDTLNDTFSSLKEEKVSDIIPQINSANSVDSDEESSSKYENIMDAATKSVKTEMLEDRFANISLESLDERKTIENESDDDSFRTATSVQEDSQILDNNQESPEISSTLDIRNNCDRVRGLANNENINDLANNRKTTDEEHADAICENKKSTDKMENLSDKIEMPSEEKLSTTSESNPRVDLFVRAIDRLSLERTSRESSRLTGKRAREAEDVEVSKKSLFDKEIHPERKPEERRPRSQISEKCRQHVIQEAKKFVRKASPLIDKCITSLIEDAENPGEKLCHKYDRRSLGEFLPFSFASKVDFRKSVGDFEERNNFCDKHKNESTNATNLCPREQDSVSAASIKNSGKITCKYT